MTYHAIEGNVTSPPKDAIPGFNKNSTTKGEKIKAAYFIPIKLPSKVFRTETPERNKIKAKMPVILYIYKFLTNACKDRIKLEKTA